MTRSRIVTDGGADLPAELAERLGIAVVEGPIHFGDELFDGDAATFWDRVRRDEATPSTAPPAVDALAAAFAGDDPVVAIHVSAELSRTEEHAKTAAARVANPVHVVDSRSMSVGTALVAMVAAEAAAVDLDVEKLKPIVRGLVDRVHVHAVIEAVDYLIRGGRAGLLDTASLKHGTRQVVAVKGHAILLRQVKDRHRATRDLLEHITHAHVRHGVDRWAVGHGDAADVDAFVREAQATFGTPPAFVTLLGPAVGTHTGPDALVVGLLAKP